MNPRAGSPAGIISVIFFALAAGSFYWVTVSGMTVFYGLAALFVLLGSSVAVVAEIIIAKIAGENVVVVRIPLHPHPGLKPVPVEAAAAVLLQQIAE